MTIYSITVDFERLILINKYAASKEDTRYYLNGVSIEIENGDVTMVATDGHRLIASRSTIVNNAQHIAGDRTTFIIPRKILEGYKLKKNSADQAVIEYDSETWAVTIKHENTQQTFQAVDGTFPDWRRVLPSAEPNGEPAQFDAKYLADFQAYSKILGGHAHAFIGHNGNNPALVALPDGDVGVLMPIRCDSTFALPEWVNAA